MQNTNSLKLGRNYAYRNPKLLQLLGDFVPQTPYRGFAPGPHWGTSVPQTPCTGRPPHFVPGLRPAKPASCLEKDLIQGTTLGRRGTGRMRTSWLPVIWSDTGGLRTRPVSDQHNRSWLVLQVWCCKTRSCHARRNKIGRASCRERV